eukprot:2084271-Alexandrium_andersonii.AAC.1
MAPARGVNSPAQPACAGGAGEWTQVQGKGTRANATVAEGRPCGRTSRRRRVSTGRGPRDSRARRSVRP